MVMPDQDRMLPPNAYNITSFPWPCEQTATGPVSPLPGSGTRGETPPSPTGPMPVGGRPSPPAAHMPMDFRPWAAVPCCRCWCHGASSQSWPMMSPPPVCSKPIMRSNNWDYPENSLALQMVGGCIYLKRNVSIAVTSMSRYICIVANSDSMYVSVVQKCISLSQTCTIRRSFYVIGEVVSNSLVSTASACVTCKRLCKDFLRLSLHFVPLIQFHILLSR